MSHFNVSYGPMSSSLDTQLINVNDDTRLITLESYQPNAITSHPTMHRPYHETSMKPTVHHGNHHHVHHASSNVRTTAPQNSRPLSTYTSLGSPIHHRAMVGSGRARSMSLGDGAASGELSGAYAFASPPSSGPHMFHGIGNPQASGMGIWMRPDPLSHPVVFVSPTSSGTNTSGHSSKSVVGVATGSRGLSEAHRQAFDSALATEHARARACEQEEASLNADELRAILKRERMRSAQQGAEVAMLQCHTPSKSLQPTETLEESRMIGLMQRMDMVQAEEGRVVAEIEQEEEMLSNTLQRKLEVQREKRRLEEQIALETNACTTLQHELSTLRNCSNRKRQASLEEEDEMEEES